MGSTNQPLSMKHELSAVLVLYITSVASSFPALHYIAVSDISSSTHIFILSSSDENKFKMICDQCQAILNLDILLGTLAEYGPEAKDRAHPHHKNFPALQSSAEAGCTICKLVLGRLPPNFNDTTMVGGHINFRLTKRDILSFDNNSSSSPPGTLSFWCSYIRLSALEGM